MLFGKASNMQANIKREGLEDLRFTLSLKCRARHRVSIVSIVRGNIFISEKKLMSNSAKHSLPGETASSGTHGFQQVCTFRIYEIHVFLVWCAFLLKQIHFASSFFFHNSLLPLALAVIYMATATQGPSEQFVFRQHSSSSLLGKVGELL